MFVIVKIYVSLVLLCPLTLALNIFLYKEINDYYDSKKYPVAKFNGSYTFNFYSKDELYMHINLKNKEPELRTELFCSYDVPITKPGGRYYWIQSTLNYDRPFNITLKICTAKNICISEIIVKGRPVSTESDVTITGRTCFRTGLCLTVVDLSNITADYITKHGLLYTTTTPETDLELIGTTVFPDTAQQPAASQTPVVLYITMSVTVICLIISLTIAFVIKYRRRNSRPVPAVRFNNCTSTNQVMYAELDLSTTNGHPVIRNEESPYAQIMGVLEPKEKVKK